MSMVRGATGLFGPSAPLALPGGPAMLQSLPPLKIHDAGAAATLPISVTDDKPPMTSPATGPMATGRMATGTITTRGSHE
ncbi:hypothetical protein [Pseudoduganella umbonata]|uniref:Uncharacterized protein n=1 Tax=Pseudoduganella umbonata TaxID=864828 RepID=A0A4P8HNV8_9BURK|nr:hypothetical protein [Pseudoduganella umbonata]MBB3220153.1 hypothetical protein [Pseudoduganella umbonata]QCP10142.1 hypothetical protein FCL38_06680 [Pseudoduganella umbonata]